MTWRSIHISYRRDQDALILDAVWPLFTLIRDQVPQTHFVRHWKRGPHLRLNVRTSPDTYAAVVRPAVDEIVGGYLAAHPSTVDLDPARLLPLHERLAELEDEPGPLLPWYPDNSIQEADFDRRLSVLGSQEAADLLTDFYVDTTDLTFQMTDQVHRRNASRLGAAFDLMITTAHVLCRGGVTKAFVCFRSHAEAFMATFPEGQGLRPSWNQHYAEHRSTLARRVSAVVATLDSEQTSVPFIRAWVDALTPIGQRAESLSAAGRLSMNPQLPAGGDGATEGNKSHPARLAEVSPFHRALGSNEWWWREIWPSDWFAAFRLTLNYTYLHLTRLGVKPVERYLLCHLAANAVEDAFGVSAMEMIRS